jgi:adenylate kinase
MVGIGSAADRVPRISILGPPGSGKSTLTRALSSEISIPQISIGERLRERARQDDDLNSLLAKGGFVDDRLAWDLVRVDLETALDHGTGCLLDGFPRTLPQRHLLEATPSFSISFVLEIGMSECVARLEERRKDGDEPRSDDLEEMAITRRFDHYRSKTVPVIEAYREDGLLHVLDATKAKDALLNDALSILWARSLRLE